MSVGILVIHTEVPNLGVTLFDGYSYDGLNAVIGVQHTEVPNLGASWSRFFMVTEAHLFSLPNDCL